MRALLDAIEGGDGRAAKLLLDRIWPAPAKGEDAGVEFTLVLDQQDIEA